MRTVRLIAAVIWNVVTSTRSRVLTRNSVPKPNSNSGVPDMEWLARSNRREVVNSINLWIMAYSQTTRHTPMRNPDLIVLAAVLILLGLCILSAVTGLHL